jgi:class 3 adenylate cyclase
MTAPMKENTQGDPDTVRAARFQISIASALSLSFGFLVFAAAASVLGIGLWSAGINTINLIRDRNQLTIDLMEQQLRGHISPMVQANDFVADLIAMGKIDPNDKEELGAQIRNSLAATPQVISAVFIADDFKTTLVNRIGNQFSITTEDWRNQNGIREAIIEGRSENQPYWGPLIWAERLKVTLLNRRAPVRQNGKFIGAYATSVAISDLSRFLTTLDNSPEISRSFILYGDKYVLAHPHMAGGSYSRDENEPIPDLTTIGDAILENIWNKKLQRSGIGANRGTKSHLLDFRDNTYAFLYRRLDGLSAVPLYAGRYIKLERSIGVDFIRLWRAGVVGLVVTILAVIAAFWLGRKMAKPIRNLAAAADQIRDLHLDPAPQLNRSRLKELDEAAIAFNAMTTGLKWFETYVPKTLVHLLLNDKQTSSRLASAERDVTVMFTDIRSFTTLSESLAAAEVADLLNEHFGLIARCVEDTEGTIDKYIGDSVMAFWGAPTKMADHANRACASALAIRKTIDTENMRRAEAGLPAIKMGIGIHTGRAIAGNIGAPGRVNYTLVGDTVNLAQRIEQLCKPLAATESNVTILVSDAVAEEVTENFTLNDMGSQPIRGRNEPIDVFRLK